MKILFIAFIFLLMMTISQGIPFGMPIDMICKRETVLNGDSAMTILTPKRTVAPSADCSMLPIF